MGFFMEGALIRPFLCYLKCKRKQELVFKINVESFDSRFVASFRFFSLQKAGVKGRLTNLLQCVNMAAFKRCFSPCLPLDKRCIDPNKDLRLGKSTP